ncbi:putative RNA polymerase II subunit B1 CTD phosphatase RPAP2 [Nilaparvata lugens]|nr:putative RNA polymerase II subunit B1 CTD phosphatase RPAP2 [Nilaparvata lugens]
MKDSKFDKEVREESVIPTKPLPDFKKLREEAKEMELKVRSFYAGDKRVQFSNAIIEESEAKDEKPNVLPLVDQHAQHAFRRRIVLDHLNKVLPDVMKTVGITNLISKKDMRDLVHTFTLSASNVVFKPIEWQFIAIIIVKL